MKLLKFLDDHFEEYLLTILYLMVFVSILMEVIQRFLLSFSTSWGEEVARYCFIYLIWISVSLCLKNRIHLKIDLIQNVLSNRAKSMVYLFSELVTGVVVIFCIYLSMHPVLLSFEYESVTDGLRVIKGIFLFSVPFGLSLLFIRLIQNIIIDIKNIIDDKPPYSGNAIF